MPLIVFDLDGTLIDSQQDLADAANALIVERGGTPLSTSAVASMVGEGAAVLVRRALTAAGLPDDGQAALARFLELYDERLLHTTRLYDGMDDVLEDLKHDTALAVLTNKPGQASRRILDGLGLTNTFQWVVGGDTRFGRKPDPAGLRSLMTEAGCGSTDTVMVGDSAVDLATARAAPTRVCIARYGFGFKPAAVNLRDDELVVDRPKDIVAAVRRALSQSPVRHTATRAAGPGTQDSGTGG